MDVFLKTCNSGEKILVRNIEKVSKKLISAKWRSIFNQACVKENIYIYIYIHIHIYI